MLLYSSFKPSLGATVNTFGFALVKSSTSRIVKPTFLIRYLIYLFIVSISSSHWLILLMFLFFFGSLLVYFCKVGMLLVDSTAFGSLGVNPKSEFSSFVINGQTVKEVS
jgi:hypothetical protein